MHLVRHGETDFNSEDTNGGEQFRGWVNIPLNEKGRQEAVDVAKKFKNLNVDVIFSSPFQRATYVAKKIGDVVGAPVHKTDALKPWHIGEFTGKLVKKHLPELLLHQKYEDQPVKGGEPFKQFRQRFLGALRNALAYEKKTGKVIVLVTHVRNAQLARAWDAAKRPDDLTFDLDTMNDYKNALGTGDVMEIIP